MAAAWQPKEELLNEIYGILKQQITRPRKRTWTAQQFQSKFPDLNNYLAFILARAEGKSLEVRHLAGLFLKNNLKSTFKSMPAANQGYIKSELLHCLEVADMQIKGSVGTTISVLFPQVGVSGWPELLEVLFFCLSSDKENCVECAMDAFLKICEDNPQVLSSKAPGLSQRFINLFLPRLFMLFRSPNALLREQSLRSVNQYIKKIPTVLSVSMDQYVQGLIGLANDTVKVRIVVCAAFDQLIKDFPPSFAPHLRNVIECILKLNQDPDEFVAMRACQIWSVYYRANLPQENLQEFLPHLIQVLLTNLVYREEYDSLVNAEEDGSVPDRDQDLQEDVSVVPVFPDQDQDDQYDEFIGRWTLRRCSVDALEFIATMFEHEILPTLMPIVQRLLATLFPFDDETWKEREAVVLALGTIADECFNGLYPHLPGIVDFLCQLLDDKFPMIRSTSCWTLSRFKRFIVEEIGHQEGQERFANVLTGLLQRILDDNKRVQASACSALLILAEGTAEELTPHLGIILQHLMCAFKKYQRRNLRIVYDAITTLADAVGEKLNKPEHLDVLLPPLISKWQQFSDSNRDLYPLMDCFKLIAQALGGRFSQFAQPVFQGCISVIQTRQLAKTRQLSKVHSASAGVQCDDELVVCSLDLLSKLAGVESLVSQSNLGDLLLQCCMDNDAADIREKAFALLGHLARVCPIHLQPRSAAFFDIAAKQLKVRKLKEASSVADRACSVIGELAIKVHQEVRPSVTRVLPCLFLILRRRERSDTSLRKNSAFTLGRLAWVFPELVAPHIHRYMQPWCIALSMLSDSVMKEDAFRGLCAVVRENPSVDSNSLVFIFKSIASLQVIRSEDLRTEVSQILSSYKQKLSNEEWEKCMSALEEPVKDKLSQYFAL